MNSIQAVSISMYKNWTCVHKWFVDRGLREETGSDVRSVCFGGGTTRLVISEKPPPIRWHCPSAQLEAWRAQIHDRTICFNSDVDFRDVRCKDTVWNMSLVVYSTENGWCQGVVQSCVATTNRIFPLHQSCLNHVKCLSHLPLGRIVILSTRP